MVSVARRDESLEMSKNSPRNEGIQHKTGLSGPCENLIASRSRKKQKASPAPGFSFGLLGSPLREAQSGWPFDVQNEWSSCGEGALNENS